MTIEAGSRGGRVPGYLGRVIGDGDNPVGTCFQVAPRVLVTAWHVLEAIGAGIVGAEVRVDPLAGGNPFGAAIARMDQLRDLAILVADTPLSAVAGPLIATDHVAPRTTVTVTGHVVIDDPGRTLRSLTAIGHWAGSAMWDTSVSVGRITADAVLPGMSGAPVIRDSDGAVTGVVSGRYNTADGWLAGTVWVARTEDLTVLLDGIADVRIGEAITLGPPPPGLLAALSREDLVVFVGAGLAADAGYPVWSELVTGLLDRAEQQKRLAPQLLVSLQSSLKLGEYNSVADAVAGAVDRSDLANSLGEVFSPPDDTLLPDAYQALGALPAAAVLTTNYDQLPHRTWPDLPRFTLADSGRMLDHLSLGQRFVLYVYGSLDQPESLLFSPAQLDELLETNLEVAKALEGLFSSRTMLFVGASLSGILDFVQSLSVRSRAGPGHYAVVHVDSPSWRAHADRLRRRYNIEVLPYGGASHAQVATFLSHLGRQPSRHGKGAAQGRAEKLTKVVLENIGPHEYLQLDLDPQWNVLLGDNGVGKSSILKAIALVYSANDAPVYADRLLRVGASRGSIRVETDAGRSFLTELLRSTTGIQVRHAPEVRLEAEGQLVMGFPPLRSLSWRRESGPSGGEAPRRPSSTDLLPLLIGDPDPRLDSVKQHMINSDYLTKDALTKEADAAPYRRLLDDLARAMQVLTEGLDVRFSEVDASSNAVFVDTADGRLPIEALSQGTGSLIGWVSVIIKRLHDTAAEGEVPLEREAIVLVDELDAHLHPDWQQQLTHRLETLFPHVQFVGTTHSPLIVGGLKHRQVTALTRQEGQATKVELPGEPEQPIRGRADQLLTGRLFGLATSVDMETRRAVTRYNELLGKDRTQAEDAEFNELQEILEVRIPVDATTTAEQRAQDLLDLLLQESLGPDRPAVRDRLLENARQLLEEAARMRPLSE